MSPPIPDVPLQGREAYVWAWLLHGPVVHRAAGYVSLAGWDLYPIKLDGWKRGRETLWNAAKWAREASEKETFDARRSALMGAPEGVRPNACKACKGSGLGRIRECRLCHGSGMVHVWQEAKP